MSVHVPQRKQASAFADPSYAEARLEEFIARIAPAYLANSAEPAAVDIAAWRRGRLTPFVNALHGSVSGYRRRRWGSIGERLVWLEGGNPKGVPVVLLHGFGVSKENWLPLLPFLGRKYRVLLIDLPGWGESHFSLGDDYGLAAQAQRIEAWRAAVLGEPVHLVGNSMGGAIAKLVNASHPGSIRSLTLMNALGLPGAKHSEFVSTLEQGKNDLIPNTLRGVMRLASMAIHRLTLPLLLAPLFAPELVGRRHVNEHLFRQMLSRVPDFSQIALSANTSPVLIVWGDQDELLDVSAVDAYVRAYRRAEAKIFRKVGHLPMVEAPRRCARTLLDFWARADSNRRKTA